MKHAPPCTASSAHLLIAPQASALSIVAVADTGDPGSVIVTR